jgi:uncharacterized protein
VAKAKSKPKAKKPASRPRRPARSHAEPAAPKARPSRSAAPATASSRSLSAADARRIALAAQGFGSRPGADGNAPATLANVRGVFDHVGLIQVDSVNVLVRSQELPLWARLGAHPRDALPALTKQNVLFEYWAHEASLLPVEDQPLFRWRMEEAKHAAWAGIRKLAKRDPGYITSVRDEVHARGSLAARELEQRGSKGRGSTKWWGWDDRKRALAYLFWAGEISAIRTYDTFERVYAPFAKVVPAAILAQPTPTPSDARRELLVRAARHHGLGTLRDLADYYRINVTVARPLLAELVEDGRLEAVHVEGWREPAYLHPSAPAPRAHEGRALLSPFDSLVWARARTERLFGFSYRIEIYTPAPKRVHGYYVLPFLLDEALVARVDLKADRHARTLRAHAVYAEPGAPASTAAEVAAELRAMARWLGLDNVAVGRRGNLSAAVRRSL